MSSRGSDEVSEATDEWHLTDKGRIMVDYISDLFEDGMDIEQIAKHLGIQTWCIQQLFILESRE